VARLNSEAPRLLERAVLGLEGSALLPGGGTLFLFNHLLQAASTPDDPDLVFEFLVTSRSVASGELATIGLGRHMVSEAPSSSMIFRPWSESWMLPSNPADDLAMMPFAGLRSHAAAKGWRWNTQEVTDGMLLKVGETIHVSATEPAAAYGYERSQPEQLLANKRPELRRVRLTPEPNGSVSVSGVSPAFSGAPVLALSSVGSNQLRFVVVGMVGSVATGAPSESSSTLPLTGAWTIRRAAAEIHARLTQQQH